MFCYAGCSFSAAYSIPCNSRAIPQPNTSTTFLKSESSTRLPSSLASTTCLVNELISSAFRDLSITLLRAYLLRLHLLEPLTNNAAFILTNLSRIAKVPESCNSYVSPPFSVAITSAKSVSTQLPSSPCLLNGPLRISTASSCRISKSLNVPDFAINSGRR